jgi:hypothetical protein
MRIYLDNCCYNRPFDDQRNLTTALETFAKLQIQALMRSGILEYVWSDSLCHEVEKNPFPRRCQSIVSWLGGAAVYIETTDDVIERAKEFVEIGVKKMDALHLASAAKAGCDWFFTTDKGILKKVREVDSMRVANPVEFVVGRDGND